MATLSQIELTVPDAGVAGRDFAAIVGVTPDHVEAEFAQVTLGGFRIRFTPSPAVPMSPTTTGVVLYLQVADLDAERRRLAELGATILDDTGDGVFVEAPAVVIAYQTA